MILSALSTVLWCAVLSGIQQDAGVTNAKQFQCEDHEPKELVEIITNKELTSHDSDLVYDAMRCLGWKRSVDFIPAFINLLTWKHTYSYEKTKGAIASSGITTGTRYPATSALVEIGKPALPALVKVIEAYEVGSLEAKNARYTVRAIFHYERSPSDEFFKEAAAKAATPEAKQRLLKALETADEDIRPD